MRVAFFSPLPPHKSGIADYSAALLAELEKLATVETFTGAPTSFDPSYYDIALYQLGNNPYHTFVYEAALQYPGVVVMHEANLHHLIADLTISRGDWDAYLREVDTTAVRPRWPMPNGMSVLSNAAPIMRASPCCAAYLTAHAARSA